MMMYRNYGPPRGNCIYECIILGGPPIIDRNVVVIPNCYSKAIGWWFLLIIERKIKLKKKVKIKSKFLELCEKKLIFVYGFLFLFENFLCFRWFFFFWCCCCCSSSSSVGNIVFIVRFIFSTRFSWNPPKDLI